MRWPVLLAVLVALSLLAMVGGVAVGSTGWSPPWTDDRVAQQILWDIRAPRSIGAWTAGALLGLGGAIAQGLFRNPLADPYLLGSSAGAALGVALLLAFAGVSPAASALGLRFGLTGAAFVGAIAAVWLTLVLAQGAAHTLRLLLAGVVVGVVLGAFMLGTTGFLGWNSVAVLVPALVACLLVALACSRALDALTLGESAAASLGVRLALVRTVLVATLALATGAAVAQAGLIAFVGLVSPHLVRGLTRCTHGALLLLSSLTGGVLLLSADIAARWVIAPQELPVGVLTAVLGGGYLLWLMHRQPGMQKA